MKNTLNRITANETMGMMGDYIELALVFSVSVVYSLVHGPELTPAFAAIIVFTVAAGMAVIVSILRRHMDDFDSYFDSYIE